MTDKCLVLCWVCVGVEQGCSRFPISNHFRDLNSDFRFFRGIEIPFSDFSKIHTGSSLGVDIMIFTRPIPNLNCNTSNCNLNCNYFLYRIYFTIFQHFVQFILDQFGRFSNSTNHYRLQVQTPADHSQIALSKLQFRLT